jgi:hypothetical protein
MMAKFVMRHGSRSAFKEHNMTWSDVLQPNVAVDAARVLLAENEELRAQLSRLRANTPSSWRPVWTAGQKIAQALEWTAILTDWEREFVTSIAGRRHLTARQQGRLDEISMKIESIARARGVA